MPEDLKEFLAALRQLPNEFVNIILLVIDLMLYLALFIAILLIIWGVIEWVSGWNEISGKKNIIRGVVLFTIATAILTI